MGGRQERVRKIKQKPSRGKSDTKKGQRKIEGTWRGGSRVEEEREVEKRAEVQPRKGKVWGCKAGGKGR